MRTALHMKRGNMRWQHMALLVVALWGNGFPQLSNADAVAGKALFNQCVGCHAVGSGATHRFGPQLNGILERGAGQAEGYSYSSAFMDRVSTGLTWDVGTLNEYLAAPMNYMPGTKMAYPGLGSEQERLSVIDYLASIKTDGTIEGIPEQDVSGATKQVKPKRVLARDTAIPAHGILHLGRAALIEEVTAWDIDIRPDGKGLPEGSGTVEVGGELYDSQCASCHGVFGEGEGRWPILAGGQDTLTEERPEKTIGSYWPYLSTVYDYVRRAMPFGNARSLSDDDVYALTAYLLYLNDRVDESFELTSDNFTSIAMPNEANFFPDDRADEPWFEFAGEPCMSDCIEGVATVSQRARILDVTPDTDADEAEGGVD